MARDPSRPPPHPQHAARFFPRYPGTPHQIVAQVTLRHRPTPPARQSRGGVNGRVIGAVPTPAARMGRTLKGDAMDPEFWAVRPLVLLAEDEAIIAIDLEDSLTAAGFAVAGPFATNADTRAWLETSRPDIAILDHALKDGLCDALVGDLAGRGVPAIIFTGHDAEQELLSELSAVTWVTKPIAFATLLGTIRDLLRARGDRTRAGTNPS